MEPTHTRKSSGPSGKKIAQIAVPVLVLVVIVVVALVARGSGGDDKKAGDTQKTGETELVKAGPMTPAKAKLEGKTVDFGPHCDAKRGTIAIPSVYAPPCVEPFKGDNGGATAPGVTKDTITVVAYEGDPKFDSAAAALTRKAGVEVKPGAGFQAAKDFVELYSNFYELYGRKVVLERYVGRGAADDVQQSKADAIDIAEKFKPFAVIGGPTAGAFAEELVARQIMIVGTGAGSPTEDDLAKQTPYRWPVGPSGEQYSRLTGEFVDRALKGKKAEYAGDALKGQDRVFGALYYQVPGEPSTTFDAFKEQLAKDGIKLAAEVPYELDLSRTQEISRTSISKLKAAGVTTVLLAADPFSPLSFTTEATAQDWFPEWVIGPNVSVDLSLAARLYDQKQWVHAFGITPLAVPSTEAARKPYDLYDWYFHRKPPINTYRSIDLSVGLLMAGIHMAGADLTAQTFGDGLFRIPPQKWSSISPLSVRGRDGLWPGYGRDYVDRYGTDNLTVIWYDPTATGEDEVGNSGTGLYQFADKGQRYGQGQMPSDPKVFDPGTSVDILEAIAPDLAPPSYPSPTGGS